MSPTAGPTGGGTEIVLQGSDFVSGSALLIDGLKIENPYISATEIRGVTQRHDPGPAMVQVLNGTALSAPRRFDFVAAPSVKLVSPARGPLAGGTWMAVVGNYFREGETTIRIGGVLLEDPCFVSVNRIEGRLPAGAAAGAVEVTADDPIGGAGPRSVTFTYDAAETTELDPLGGDLQMLCPGVQ
jgi:hypothetical protein